MFPSHDLSGDVIVWYFDYAIISGAQHFLDMIPVCRNFSSAGAKHNKAFLLSVLDIPNASYYTKATRSYENNIRRRHWHSFVVTDDVAINQYHAYLHPLHNSSIQIFNEEIQFRIYDYELRHYRG